MLIEGVWRVSVDQTYKKDKVVVFNGLSKCQIFISLILIIIALFSFYMLIVLASFNPYDQSWSQAAWNKSISNFGGVIGALVSDILLLTFGVIAYILPLIMLALCWIAFRYQSSSEKCIDYFAISFRLVGALAILVTSCGLASINCSHIYYFSSGGVIGGFLVETILSKCHTINPILVLLSVFFEGVTLVTNCSWFLILEKIGSSSISLVTLLTNYVRTK